MARAILDYLARHPQANDTIEGIVQWWLLENQVHHSVAEARRVLAQFEAEALVLAGRGPDGRVHYRLNPSKRREIRKWLKARRTAGATA